MSARRLFANSLLSVVAKSANALIQLLSLPVLLGAFGKESYGLIVIAMSLNTFILIVQLGLPTAMPKFVAEWLAKGEKAQLNGAARTVISFYLMIALINMLVLLAIAIGGASLFAVTPAQYGTLQKLLVITAITSFLAIPANMLDQLLIGAQELGFVSTTQLVKNCAYAALVAFTYFNPHTLDIAGFYILQCVIMFMMIPMKLRRWRRYGSIGVFMPGVNLAAISPLSKYCLSLMTFVIFVSLSEKLRPVILGMRTSGNAGETLSDYQIVNNIRLFLTTITSSLMAALIPHISGAAARGNVQIYGKMITEGTKYVWSLGALVVFGVIMLSKEALCIYVGSDNVYLQTWLIIFLIGVLYNVYSAPIASVILSSGIMRPMIWASATGCVMSALLCWLFTPQYGIGAVAVSLIAHNAVTLLVTHFVYLPKYFHVKPVQQIRDIMLPPVAAGAVMCVVGRFIIERCGSTNNYTNVAIGVVCGVVIYSSIVLSAFIRPNEMRGLIAKLVKV